MTNYTYSMLTEHALEYITSYILIYRAKIIYRIAQYFDDGKV